MSFLPFAMLALLVIALLFAMLRRAQRGISTGGGNGTVESAGLYSSRSDAGRDSGDGGDGDGGGGGD